MVLRIAIFIDLLNDLVVNKPYKWILREQYKHGSFKKWMHIPIYKTEN